MKCLGKQTRSIKVLQTHQMKKRAYSTMKLRNIIKHSPTYNSFICLSSLLQCGYCSRCKVSHASTAAAAVGSSVQKSFGGQDVSVCGRSTGGVNRRFVSTQWAIKNLHVMRN